jgi:hypothetical protein
MSYLAIKKVYLPNEGHILVALGQFSVSWTADCRMVDEYRDMNEPCEIAKRE